MPMSLTMKDASRESGLSLRLLYRLIAEGKLTTTTVGRRRLVLTHSLVDLLTEGLPRATRAAVLDQLGDGAEHSGAKKKRIAK
jgi:hypothetical protein